MITELKSTLEVISGYTDEKKDGLSLQVFGFDESPHSPVVMLTVCCKDTTVDVYVENDELMRALQLIEKVYGKD